MVPRILMSMWDGTCTYLAGLNNLITIFNVTSVIPFHSIFQLLLPPFGLDSCPKYRNYIIMSNALGCLFFSFFFYKMSISINFYLSLSIPLLPLILIVNIFVSFWIYAIIYLLLFILEFKWIFFWTCVTGTCFCSMKKFSSQKSQSQVVKLLLLLLVR